MLEAWEVARAALEVSRVYDPIRRDARKTVVRQYELRSVCLRARLRLLAQTVPA